MKNKISTMCGYIIGTIIFLMLPIIIISYFTYSERIVIPVLLAIISICFIMIVINEATDKKITK